MFIRERASFRCSFLPLPISTGQWPEEGIAPVAIDPQLVWDGPYRMSRDALRYGILISINCLGSLARMLQGEVAS